MNEAIVLHSIRAVKDWRRLMGATPVIWTNGCFDLFHLGHVSFLNDAKQADEYGAGALVVGVNSDESVARIKGPGRPVLPLIHRVHLVASHRAVDAVVPFSGDEPLKYIEAAEPDWVVKDESYRGKVVVGAGLARRGVRYARFHRIADIGSTTDIIKRIKELEACRQKTTNP